MSAMKKNVLVVGMARSGTSLTAGIFGRNGYHVGSIASERLREGDDNNPFGYFEADDLIEHNVGLLRLAGFRAHNSWLYEPVDDAVVAKLAELEPGEPERKLVEAYASHAPWVWKDPRLCYTLPVWWKLLDPETTRVILVERDPEQVYRSFRRKGWCDGDEKLQVIERALHHTRTARDTVLRLDIPHLALSYGETLREPELTAEKIGAFCGLELTAAQLNVRPELDHSRGSARLTGLLRGQLARLPLGLRRRLSRIAPRRLLGGLVPEWRYVSRRRSRDG
jgi:hypothetical protein